MSENRRGGQRIDLLALQNELGPVIDPEFFDVNDVAKEIRKLRILPFHLDRKKTNVVSEVDGVIVFVDRYHTDRVAIGDVWLCSLVEKNYVYYATPLKKITAATAMDLSENMREQMIDALWTTNRKSYEKMFEDRYRAEIYERATEEVASKDKDIIESLRRKVEDLSNQLEQSRVVIESRIGEGGTDDEEITLGVNVRSDAPIPSLGDPDGGTAPSPRAGVLGTSDAFVPPAMLSGTYQAVPGLPEIRNPEITPRTEPIMRKFRVERLEPEMLYSESFPDGKYFVHINISKKFLVIRPNSYGQAICINHRMTLSGLDELSSFVGQKTLVAEWDQRYEGLLVYL